MGKADDVAVASDELAEVSVEDTGVEVKTDTPKAKSSKENNEK